ncbi:MAG TPA: YggT family protein [Anaerolineales bacterium]|nr:YggT family protein [Anaerolineales bacterium]
MFISTLIRLIDLIANALILLVVLSVVLSYFVSPYHRVRQSIDSVVQPMLVPIRRVVPLVGMLDFSPVLLIILIQILSSVLRNFLFVLR